jgi:hypothetical protein
MDKQSNAAAKWMEEKWTEYRHTIYNGRVSLTPDELTSLLAAFAADVEAGKWVAINSENLPEPGSWAISQSKAGAIYPRFYSGDEKQYWLDNFVAYQPMPAPYVPAQQEEQV